MLAGLRNSAGSSGQWPRGIFSRIPAAGYGGGTVFSSMPCISGRTGPKVRTILVSSTLLLTVISSVGLGVVSAYGAIQGILQVFAQHPHPQEEPLTALVAQEATAQQ